MPSGHRYSLKSKKIEPANTIASCRVPPESSKDRTIPIGLNACILMYLNLKAVDISRHKRHCGIVTFDSTRKSQDQEINL